MADIESLHRSMPAGSITLNELVFLESCQREQTTRPGSAYDLAMRERLRAKGLNEPEIERRLSLGRRNRGD